MALRAQEKPLLCWQQLAENDLEILELNSSDLRNQN